MRKLALGLDKVAADVSKVTADVGKVSADVGKVSADVGKVTADVGKVTADVGKVTADVGKVLLAQQEAAAADEMSYMSPSGRAYEELVGTKIDEWLRATCGLIVTVESRRGVASTDPSAGGMQWDARLAVTCARDWVAPPRAATFVVFGGLDYARPDPLPAPRNLSPLKPVAAEYLAVLEFTRNDNWYETWKSESGKKVRKGLLERFEARLAICVQRARAAVPQIAVATALDVVALVGLVGEYSCREGVEALLSKADCPYPELQRMFAARRFVFFYYAPLLALVAPVTTTLG